MYLPGKLLCGGFMDRLVKLRIYGSDKDFGDWLRKHADLLPSRTGPTRQSDQDMDTLIHHFMNSIDGQGSREIQGLMIIEVKTRNGRPDNAQRDSWFKVNLFRGKKEWNGQLIRFHGVFYLFLSGTDPDNSEKLQWGRYDENGNIVEIEISRETCMGILQGKVHPYNLTKGIYRRHHKTEDIARQQKAPLGFIEFVHIKKRS